MFPKGPEQYKIASDMFPEELEEQRTNWVKNQIVDCDRYAAKKHAEKDGPQDRPEVEKQRNTVYQKTEHQEVEQAEVRRAQSMRAF